MSSTPRPQTLAYGALEETRELERIIAGTTLVPGTDISPIRLGINPDDFTDPALAMIVRIALQLDAEGVSRDNITIADRLAKTRLEIGDGTWLDRVGGRARLLVLQRDSLGKSALPSYVDLLIERIRKRHLLDAAEQARSIVSDPSIDAEDAASRIRLLFVSPESSGDRTEPSTAWPAPIADFAWHGLAGDIVRAIEPTTEADPIALLMHVLAYFGNAAGLVPSGTGPHVMVEETAHGPNEFVCLVGATSKARKGTAERRVRKLFQAADVAWLARIRSGLSSGEGLIWNVRDATTKDGKVEDPGETDKRLLLVESELASVLRRIERDGSSLSPILRDAWDRMPLNTLVSERSGRAAVMSSIHHVSVVGHITRAELVRYLTRTEMANGLANRFLWALVTRSKYLPRGSAPPATADLVRMLHAALQRAASTREIDLDATAQKAWSAVYPALSDPKPGLAGEIVARGEPHVLRLALIYALLDSDSAIRPAHLLAALSVWTYCEDSVRCMFASHVGDPDADAVLEQLRQRQDGLTLTELRDAFGRNWSSERVQTALKALIEHGLAEQYTTKTRGRPATHFRCVGARRGDTQTYLDYALNAINAETPESSSQVTTRVNGDGTRKVEGGQFASDLARTSGVLFAYEDGDIPNSGSRFSRIPRSSVPSPQKSPATNCQCGRLDWEVQDGRWRCHACGADCEGQT